MSLQSSRRIKLFIAAFLFCAAFYSLVGTRKAPTCIEIQSIIANQGYWAPVAFICLYTLSTVLFVPGTLPTVIGGIVFGPWLGTALVSVGALLGSVIAFLIARYLASDWLEKRLNQKPWYRKIEHEFQQNTFAYMLFLRLSPIFPYNGVNYASGLLPMKLSVYTLSSALGMLPGTLIYVYAGHSVGCTFLTPGSALSSDTQLSLILTLVGLSALSILPIWMKKRGNRP